MVFKTKGIVLKSSPISETSIIVRILTQEFGLKSYIVKGARQKKAKIHANIFQPLIIMQLEVYNNPKKDIQIIAETFISKDTNIIMQDFYKQSIVMFISEVINMSIKQEEKNDKLFTLLENQITELTLLEKNYAAFPIIFLKEITTLLGFTPMNNYSKENLLFDLNLGAFSSTFSQNSIIIEKEESKLFSDFLKMEKEQIKELSVQQKSKLLQILIDFYQIHILDNRKITSHLILKTILN